MQGQASLGEVRSEVMQGQGSLVQIMQSWASLGEVRCEVMQGQDSIEKVRFGIIKVTVTVGRSNSV